MESPDIRRRTMQAVKSKNTAIEMRVRSMLHRRGYRFRLHRRGLPGCPDLVFSGRKKVIFVHGCFWHAHGCPRGNRAPKTNTGYWTAKIARTAARDASTSETLRSLGWESAIVWECELLHNPDAVLRNLVQFLGPNSSPPQILPK